jgi:hypothetical protein
METESLVKEMVDKWFKDLPVKPLTKRAAVQLLLGVSLSIPCQADFGVDTDDHYYALRVAIKSQETDDDETLRNFVKELDKAYGNGKRLTALVKKYAPHYSKGLVFKTFWDELPRDCCKRR